MRKIGPKEELKVGTKVNVSGKIGNVVKATNSTDQFGGDIVVHTIQFYKKVVGKGFANVKSINERQKVNYSFIDVID